MPWSCCSCYKRKLNCMMMREHSNETFYVSCTSSAIILMQKICQHLMFIEPVDSNQVHMVPYSVITFDLWPKPISWRTPYNSNNYANICSFNQIKCIRYCALGCLIMHINVGYYREFLFFSVLSRNSFDLSEINRLSFDFGRSEFIL